MGNLWEFLYQTLNVSLAAALLLLVKWLLHDKLPLYNDKNSRLIRTLSEVYNEVTGKTLSPVAIGGGTYARALRYGAAFGPEEEGEESTIHQPDEYITFEKIQKCFEIYKLALKRLCS